MERLQDSAKGLGRRVRVLLSKSELHSHSAPAVRMLGRNAGDGPAETHDCNEAASHPASLGEGISPTIMQHTTRQ